ncbi:hypothetical protein ABPG75_005590 [Micractinium tetrahymenae]
MPGQVVCCAQTCLRTSSTSLIAIPPSRPRPTPSRLMAAAAADGTVAAAGATQQSSRALPRVLSIQSHVVSGYVGNKCAVFPLQLLGFDVDPVNSVQFSNHTGFPTWNGDIMSGEELWRLVEGLEANGLCRQYTHLLTGYIGSLSVLQTIVRVAEKLRQCNPDLVYVCDPVMGDDGRLYVRPEMPAAFRDLLVPLASVLTPNQLETEQLTGRSIGSEADALAACAALHVRGPHTVVITSSALPGWEDHVTLLASTTLPQKGGAPRRLRMRVPRVHAYFTGTGDLFTALLLGWMHRHPGDLKSALEAAVGGLQAVLRDTVAACGDAAAAKERTAEVCAARELRLVQNQAALAAPQRLYAAEPIDMPAGTGLPP